MIILLNEKGERMEPVGTYIIAFLISAGVTVASTPLVKRLAWKLNAVDAPNLRRINQQKMPSMGGLSIIFGFLAGYLYLWPDSDYTFAILIGGSLMAVIGIVDDKKAIPARYKFLTELVAAAVIVTSGLQIDFVNVPFIGYMDFGWLSIPITMFWIVGITNAINLIDGLDGLASGVSSIALTGMLIMGIIDQEALAISLAVILLAGTAGFLFFNTHPAKIYMGDTGALFIGFLISVISISGLFKNLAVVSLIIPVIILGVPILDTSFAIIRRLLKRQKLSTPDKSHLHHHLLALGFSHRISVYIIYAISIFFAAAAIIFSESILWGTLLITLFLLIMLQFTAEVVGILKDRKTPLINTVKRIVVLGQDSKSK